MSCDMNVSAGRKYSSPLRAEQAEQTTARIVQAAVDLLSEGDASDLSMSEVAERAGVSVRTVYRSFASKDELLDGVIDWINGHFGSVMEAPPATRHDYETTTADVIEEVFRIEPLYRALFATAAGRASHQRTARGREESMRGAYAAELEGLDDGEARRLLAVLHLVASSSGALFMKDYWDLSPEDIGRVIEWAIRVLADAAGDPTQREGL
jgi:AcrR family transcriptional regulator